MGVFGMAFSYLGFAVAHFLQFVLALTVIGLYGQDLQSANKAHVYADGKWVYAVVVGALSALTALLFLVPFILRLAHVWVWGYILFILWIALFGLFGSMFIKERAEGDAGVQRMKNAVWGSAPHDYILDATA
ncbi:hypothetical protein P8C59_001097 [Phyllachora maydis]|uniref:Uncharacterized protein n=1 Tax=Phyllachora maydis TaxID=1825666 RepID=A0AAD9HZ09_9PEZI|nr:hypothetical protein P8C59_001097 [Phyllachora maydis]